MGEPQQTRNVELGVHVVVWDEKPRSGRELIERYDLLSFFSTVVVVVVVTAATASITNSVTASVTASMTVLLAADATAML